MVGVALVVAGEQRHVDGGLNSMSPRRRKHDREELSVQTVHLGVMCRDVGGERDILGGDDGPGLGDDRLGQTSHDREGPAQLLRDGGAWVAHAGLLGDMLGKITHALERCCDAECADDDSEVTGYRLTQGDEVEAALLDGTGECINLDIARDDGLSHGEVGIEQ